MRTPYVWIPAAAAGLLLASIATAQEGEKPPARPAIRLVAAPAAVQGPSQEELTKRRTEKLAKPVFAHADWLTDYDAARAVAKKEGKLLLTYFTRSYAG